MGDPRLGIKSLESIDRELAQERLAASAISLWEAALLVERGRISLHQPMTAWREELLDSGLMEIPVDGGIGILAASLPDPPC